MKTSINPKTQECLVKSVHGLDLRGIITKFGIPEEATVNISISQGGIILASYEMSAIQPRSDVQLQRMSMKGLRDAIMNEFLSKADMLFGLTESIPDLDIPESEKEKITVSLEGKQSNLSFDVDMVFFCLACPPGFPVKWCGFGESIS